jgi:NAD(P)H dehydrogenase (quinone)
MTTIAVTAATGQLGRLALAALRDRAPQATLLALARNPAAAPAPARAPTRAFDYAAPDAAALDGVDVLVLISSNALEGRAAQHRAAIDAARAARVGRIVYTSILKGPASPMILAEDHKATETYLRASGLPFTILRNGWYTENYTGSLAGALQAGARVGAAGEARLSTAARADYAAAIAVVATSPGHAGATYELAGDSAHTMAEMAAEVSRQTGRTIPYQSLPEADYAALLTGFGLPPLLAAALAQSDAVAATGALFDDSRTLSRLIGRPTTPMAETVARALAGAQAV